MPTGLCVEQRSPTISNNSVDYFASTYAINGRKSRRSGCATSDSAMGELRAASYRHVQQPPQGSTTGENIGMRVILPPTFSGCQRQMAELNQDAMAVVRTHGKPRLFITATCNPSWPEIQDALLPNQSSDMRPGMTARVSRIKLVALLKDLTENSVLGKVVARLYVVEFQTKRPPARPHSVYTS